jgi:hypothetical protein
MPTANELLQQLLANGSLPRAINMMDGNGVITRVSDVRSEYDEGVCGPIPLRVTAYGLGGLKQTPRSAAYMVLERGTVDTGADEVRENKIRRFTGGPAPMAGDKILHLIAEDLSANVGDESPITITWADSSANNADVASPDSDASPNYKKNFLNGFSTIEFDDERAYFEMSSPPSALQTLKNKSLYIVMQFSTAAMSGSGDKNDFNDVDSHSMAVSASSTANNIIKDRFCAYAINVDSNVSFYRATSNNINSFTSNLISSDDDQGDDFAVVPVTDGEFVTSPQVSEIIIYNNVHNTTQNGDVLKYLFCKYALLTTAEV